MIFKYYHEIKTRCLLLIISLLLFVFTLYLYKEFVLFLCVKPGLAFNNFYFLFTDVREIFSTYIQLVLFLSNQILICLSFFHLFVFLSPGFYKVEYFFFKKALVYSFTLWIFALIVFYKIFLPISLNFFLNFKNFTLFTSFNLHFEAKITEYFNFFFFLCNACVLYFQFIVILVLIFDHISFKIKLVKKYKKIFHYCFLIISTLTTPPDIISQLIISLVLIFLYELLTFLNLIKFSTNNKLY
jgi:sec-independent protein translocase protein TatC